MTSAPQARRAPSAGSFRIDWLPAPLRERAQRLAEQRPRIARFALTPRGLLAGFGLVHGVYLLALFPTILAGQTQGDLPLYRLWAEQALEGQWPVIDMSWVYPAGALAPIMAAISAGAYNYQLCWFALMACANLLAVLALTGGFRRRSGYPAAWYWLAVQVLLAPVSMLRLEGFAAPLAIAGLAVLLRRPAVAGALVAAATWIKVWPAAIAAAAVAVSSARWRIVTGGLVVSALVAATVVVYGGGENLFSFATIQGDRALQLEAPVATLWVWATVLGLPGAEIRQNYVLATREVAGPGAHLAGEVVGWLMPIAFAVIVVLLWRARRAASRRNRLTPRTEQRLILNGSFALTAALIVFNKVGSPQYMLWLAPIVAVGLAVDRRAWSRVAGWMAAVCITTTLVFPILYLPLIDAEPFAASVLLARNLMVGGLFVWSVVVLWRAGAEVVHERDAAPLGIPVAAVAGG
ncbi:MAG: hypothetical protein QM677_02040 [Microbacterium sp.]